jgi:hypothetical protein
LSLLINRPISSERLVLSLKNTPLSRDGVGFLDPFYGPECRSWVLLRPFFAGDQISHQFIETAKAPSVRSAGSAAARN